MNAVWLLYDDPDYEVNQSYARLMRERGEERGLNIVTVLLSEIELRMDSHGRPYCLHRGDPACPAAILSRQRSALISRHFELMGVPVFNNALVCEICNDKRITYQFLAGLPPTGELDKITWKYLVHQFTLNTNRSWKDL